MGHEMGPPNSRRVCPKNKVRRERKLASYPRAPPRRAPGCERAARRRPPLMHRAWGRSRASPAPPGSDMPPRTPCPMAEPHQWATAGCAHTPRPRRTPTRGTRTANSLPQASPPRAEPTGAGKRPGSSATARARCPTKWQNRLPRASTWSGDPEGGLAMGSSGTNGPTNRSWRQQLSRHPVHPRKKRRRPRRASRGGAFEGSAHCASTLATLALEAKCAHCGAGPSKASPTEDRVPQSKDRRMSEPCALIID
mmetsp:Transcript_159449/g.507562  ORF Transcript_159449/g.507562 Transcript_159449/m.507562 type:complete len:252 (-) Transcript_159449:36-791(-)